MGGLGWLLGSLYRRIGVRYMVHRCTSELRIGKSEARGTFGRVPNLMWGSYRASAYTLGAEEYITDACRCI